MKLLKLNIQLFGVSASNSKTLTASSGNKGTLSVSLAENSTNASTNKSNITVTATFKMTSGGYSGYSTPRVEVWWYDNNNNTTIVRKAYTNAGTLARNESVKATATFDVEHKADGTLSGYARANWVWDGGGSYCPPSGNVATSSTALTTILRGITSITSITDSTNYIDGTFTVTANPQASGKYYKIEWYIYNQSGNKYTICTDNLGTFATGSKTIQTKTFTSAQLTNIYANSTTNAKPTLYAVVHTYNDSGYTTKILSTPAKTISVYLPEDIKPTGTVTISDTVTKPTGLTDYVRNISKPSFTISITNSNGATISNCVIKLNGSQIKSWDTAATSYTYSHTDVLPNVSNSYEVVATDTRGRKFTETGTITALDYAVPSINFTAERNSSTNTTIDLVINGAITSLNDKNAKSFIIEKKLNTATDYTTVTTLTNYTYTNYAYSITNCSADNIFNIRIRAVDSFNSSSSTVTVGTSFSLIDFKQGGKGLAFGKAATTDNQFECDLDAKFNKTVYIGSKTLLNYIYPVNTIYRSISSTDPGTLFGGTWTSLGSKYIDTGWQSFSWTNSTYINTSQSSYTQNKWRVRNGVLYIHVGAGATATINTDAETEFARLPITGIANITSAANRVWVGAIGGGGAWNGFMVMQNTNYLSVYIKPHKTSSGASSSWASSHFTIPLDNNSTITTGTYEKEYFWKRTG